MNRIDERFAHLHTQAKTAFIPFLTAGDPSAAATLNFMHVLVNNGADMLELGVPFSDPMADGAVIAKASERALAGGMTLEGALNIVAQFRQTDTNTPIILMGYLNPLEQMGAQPFARAAKAAGVDGVLTVDCPLEEGEDLNAALIAEEIAPIFLVAPTTHPERLERLAQAARGFVYYVSLKGVTGAATLDTAHVSARLAEIRKVIKLPLGVGFGIHSPEEVAALAPVADAVIVGSNLVNIVERYGEHAAEALAERTRLLSHAAHVSNVAVKK